MNNRSLVIAMDNSNIPRNACLNKKLHDAQQCVQWYVHQYMQKWQYQNTPYDCLYTPYNVPEIRLIAQQADKQMTKAAYAALVVVGIGGSHLGIQAVEQLVHGTKQTACTMPIYYVDTVDADMLYAVQQIIQKIHANQQDVLLFIISKSGTTIETIANAAVLLQQFSPQQIQDSVVCITDTDSLLHQWARQHAIFTYPIPQVVGGRFSVFTAVGLLPLACMGIDIASLCAGACRYDWDAAALRAFWMYEAMQKGIAIHDLFLFATDAHGLGLWYRQLMGETIGKKRIKDGVTAAVGIMPTVSMGSADLHSVGQLYIAGPSVRITTFVTMPAQQKIAIPSSDIATMLHGNVLAHKSINDILDAIAKGTMQTYAQHKLDYVHIHFPEKSAFYAGQFMYMAMVEMIYLATLLEINAFDQPEVELYKQATQKLLAQQ